MSDQDVLDDACLTLEQLCAAAALEREWLVRHVQEGLIAADGASVTANFSDWRFTTLHIARARRMRDIERTYDAAPELAALVADMLEEMDRLRAQLRRRV